MLFRVFFPLLVIVASILSFFRSMDDRTLSPDEEEEEEEEEKSLSLQ